MNTYEIRASRITYDFYEIKANSLEEAEQHRLTVVWIDQNLTPTLDKPFKEWLTTCSITK